MALGRRNQGSSPPPPPTPPRQFKRPRVQTARAAANAASSNTKGKGKDDVAVDPPPSSSPLASIDPVVDEGEAKDPMPNPYSLSTLPAMPARFVETTTSLKRKKD